MSIVNLNPAVKLIISLAITQTAGFLGSVFTTPAIPTWYKSLNKPTFTPPNWLFAPVWTFLFLAMGISLYLIWQKSASSPAAKSAITIFFIQLLFNILWSFMFFGLKFPLAGLVTIAILWILIFLNIIYFYKISPAAGLILIPYLLWVTFASLLNFSIWRLN